MQKHRRIVMVFIILFVGLPLAFMVPGVGGSGRDVDLATGQLAIITVGDTEVTARDFTEAFGQSRDQRARMGQSTDAIDMVADGTVDDIIEQLIQRALIAHGASANPVRPEKEYLSKQLQDDAMFKDETGQFRPELYNQWVEGYTRAGVSWDEIFELVADGVNRTAYVELVQASSFVTEAEIRDQFVRSQQKLKVKYAVIEPNVERTEEQLRAFFDADPDRFMTLEQRTIDFVAYPIVAGIPEDAKVALERARAGEDFIGLVEEYSVGANNHMGGDLGWITVTETPTPQNEIIFALDEGEISDIQVFANEYHIYKVDETRINEEDDSMEVKARRILFRPTLSDEEVAAQEVGAEQLLAAVLAADGDLATVAEGAGVELVSSGVFDQRSAEIEGVDRSDAFTVRQAMMAFEAGEISPTLVRGSRNIYVAKVGEVVAPRNQSFEEAREDVERAAINEYKQGEEYINLVDAYVARISAGAKSLADIAALVPEISVDIQETREFGVSDFLFSDGIFWNTQEAFALMDGKEPGAIAGPLVDFQQASHFLELVERIEPEAEALESQWQAAKVTQLESARFQADSERQMDYLQYLSERAQHVQGLVYRDEKAIRTLLGLDLVPTATEAPVVESDVPEAESTPVADEPSVAEDAESDAPAAEETTE